MHARMDSVVGNRIREARTNRDLSLSEVALRANISVATLSRIERDKQGLDLGLFLTLCRILKAMPRDLIGGDGSDKVDPLAIQIAGLNHDERMQLWHDLAEGRRNRRRSVARTRRLAEEVAELLAQLQFLQAEIESVQKRVRNR